MRTECEYITRNGERLAYVAHQPPAEADNHAAGDPPSQPADAAWVYLHGIESHAGWFEPAAERLARAGQTVFCLDRRGSGLNREARGFVSGHIDRFATWLGDVHDFVETLNASRRYRRILLIGLSWGGKSALAYALAHPDRVDGLVLITPGLRAAVDVPWWVKLRVAAGAALAPRTRIDLPLTPEMFTATPEHREFIRTDPLRLRQATARFLFESRRLEWWIDRRIGSLRTPTLLFLAGHDRIIDNARVREVLARARRAQITTYCYEDQTHSIQFDACERLVGDVVAWGEGLRACEIEGSRDDG